MEDLVEEVVGEIHDEFDQGELLRLRLVQPGVIVVRGDVLSTKWSYGIKLALLIPVL